jgi:hypothetical protein
MLRLGNLIGLVVGGLVGWACWSAIDGVFSLAGTASVYTDIAAVVCIGAAAALGWLIGFAFHGSPAGERPATPPSSARLPSANRGLIIAAILTSAFNVVAFRIVLVCLGLRWSDMVTGIVFTILEGAILGVSLGQLCAAAIWLVWGEGPFLSRLAIHWLVGLAMFGPMAFVKADTLTPARIVMQVCSLPAMSLAVQLPLWPLVTYCGWRIEQQASCGAMTQPQTLSLRDLFAGTGVVAVTLSLLRAAANRSLSPWEELVPLMIGVSVASLLILLPALFFLLRWQCAAAGIAVLSGYLFFLFFVCVLTPFVIEWATVGRLDPIEVLLRGTAYFSFAATATSPLWIWRWCGYRLTWPRDRNARRP